jgi:hypothetical protein
MRVEYAPNSRVSFWERWAGRAAGKGDAPKFRRRKELANEAKDHERELDFLAKELKAKRFHETRGFWPIMLTPPLSKSRTAPALATAGTAMARWRWMNRARTVEWPTIGSTRDG